MASGDRVQVATYAQAETAQTTADNAQAAVDALEYIDYIKPMYNTDGTEGTSVQSGGYEAGRGFITSDAVVLIDQGDNGDGTGDGSGNYYVAEVRNGVLGIRQISPYWEDENSQDYYVGYAGPAGGVIAYVASDEDATTLGFKYIEIMEEDMPSPDSSLIDADLSALSLDDGYHCFFYGDANGQDTDGTVETAGQGAANTAIIVAQAELYGNTYTAAQVCDDYDLGGYTDWVLPTPEDMQLIYDEGAVDLSAEYYWTSYDDGLSTDRATAFDASSGSSTYSSTWHTNGYRVRAIRTFS